jgi:hypothetical protein
MAETTNTNSNTGSGGALLKWWNTVRNWFKRGVRRGCCDDRPGSENSVPPQTQDHKAAA